jgi:hypothetical protein
MSAQWLKMIGTTENPCPESWNRGHTDFVRKPRRVRPGDHMVLYAVGGAKRVFAVAQVTSEPYPSGEKRWPFRVNISYEVNLPVSSGVHIDQVSTSKRDLRRSVRRASYIKLYPEEFERAAAKLQHSLRDG